MKRKARGIPNTITISYIAFLMLCTLIFHLLLAESLPQNPESFFAMRQAEHIAETGKPLYNDPLSYGGKHNAFNPGYFYLLAIGGILGGMTGYILIAALMYSLLPLSVFLISQRIAGTGPALAGATISIVLPALYDVTLNSIYNGVIAFPLVLFALYFFHSESKFTIHYVLCILFLALFSGQILTLALCLFVYAAVLKIENIPLTKPKKELIIFTIFLAIWSQFLIYKQALTAHGTSIIWQNIPEQLLKTYFDAVTFLDIAAGVGLLVIVAAVIAIYHTAFKTKDSTIYIYITAAGVITILLLLRLIRFDIGLLYLGVFGAIFSAVFLKMTYAYILKTKASPHANILVVVCALLLISITATGISLLPEKPVTSENLIKVLQWSAEHTPTDSVILSTLEEGDLIAAIAKRKNVIDSNFLLARNAADRLEDVKRIYTSTSTVRAIELIDTYGISHILFAGAKSFTPALRYEECIRPLFQTGEVILYEVICNVEIL